MSEEEIFNRLFFIINLSNNYNGIVGACLVRNGKILSESVSMGDGIHAEYSLLMNLKKMNVLILPTDIIYVTVEPCGKRTPGGRGEKMGDCTSNLISSGIKHVIYGSSDPDASNNTRHKFNLAGILLEQTKDTNIIKKSIDAFNLSCKDPKDWLPQL
jgi:pyrimidine deaminase RibD-like protein